MACSFQACEVYRWMLFNKIPNLSIRGNNVPGSGRILYRVTPPVVHLAQLSLMIPTPADANSPQSYMAALLANSWTISSRKKVTVESLSIACPFVAIAPAAGRSADAGAGRHQTTLLSPIPKRRPAFCARSSGEAVDSNMMRKFLCGSGSGRLQVRDGTFVRTNMR